jgi:uncharacterized YigZ family protein
MDEYRTVQDVSEGLYKEKGSKFIASVFPVETLDEVKDRLEIIRKRYHDARHHCYAYRLGEEPYDIRYNDDGEPSGTAGKPIFGQIQSFELTNVLIVVTRYFGGVKLGTGGLIQAYRAAAKDAANNAKIVVKTWKSNLEIQFEYVQMDAVMRIIKEDGLRIIRQESGERSYIFLEIRKSNLSPVIKKLSCLENLKLTVI